MADGLETIPPGSDLVIAAVIAWLGETMRQKALRCFQVMFDVLGGRVAALRKRRGRLQLMAKGNGD